MILPSLLCFVAACNAVSKTSLMGRRGLRNSLILQTGNRILWQFPWNSTSAWFDPPFLQHQDDLCFPKSNFALNDREGRKTDIR